MGPFGLISFPILLPCLSVKIKRPNLFEESFFFRLQDLPLTETGRTLIWQKKRSKYKQSDQQYQSE